MTKLDLASEHIQSNTSALGYHTHFQHHREALTAQLSDAAPEGAQGSLCVLGAGNCYDLDLTALATRYSSLHLVDIDAAALARAAQSVDPATRAKFTLHAPVDLSGMYDRLERWARLEVTPDELMAHAGNTATSIRRRVGQTFDVVVSACMLSQMQLSVLHALGEKHQLFQAARWTLNLTHFRTLAELTRSKGRALFVTDATASSLYAPSDNTQSALESLHAAIEAGQIFDFAQPTRLRELVQDDPVLNRAFAQVGINAAWHWTNGPKTTFLVYCAQLVRG